MTQADLKALRDLFEGNMDQSIALATLGLTEDNDARETYRRWQREMDETGSYQFADPGSPQGLLGAVFTGISDQIWDSEAWTELNDLVDQASPFREIWG